MKLYFVAGEASGDNHGAALIAALRKLQPDLVVCGRGGPRMKALATESIRDWSDQAGIVGLWEVLKNYPWFRHEFSRTLAEIADLKPDAVILVDYPGFNLRLARALHQQRKLSGSGVKIIYYISPQVWAWNRGRIPKMARWLDLMLCIFPFEVDLYEKSGLRTIFVGHPMIDNLGSERITTERDPSLVGLFPGSRAREVRALMPILREVMAELHRADSKLHFEIAAASENLAGMIRQELPGDRESLGKVELVVKQAAQTMQRSGVGIVASGTATLEAAFFRMPFVLIYKVAALTYAAGKMFIQVKHLGMPNVLANREIVPEFIQENARPDRIAGAVRQLLDDSARRQQMLAEFDEVIAKLGKGGADETAAQAILDLLAPK